MSTPASNATVPPPRTSFVLASRRSILAQIQTNIVRGALEKLYPSYTFTTSFMATAGDKNQTQALYLVGGKSFWTSELEDALSGGEVDLLVHSLKDVPTVLPEGMEIGAIPEREDPVDSLVVKRGLPYNSLEELPEGSVVGTSSVRRVAQLKRAFPKLVFQDVVRINFVTFVSCFTDHLSEETCRHYLHHFTQALGLRTFHYAQSDRLSTLVITAHRQTRLAKLDAPDGPFTAIILAKAGLVRIDAQDRITADIHAPTLFHAVSQGALGVEIRSDDVQVKEICERLTHWQTSWTCLAERAYLRVLEGGCSVPVGIDGELTPTTTGAEKKGYLKLTGAVTSLDGQKHVMRTIRQEVSSVEEAEKVGSALAKEMINTGAREILDEINKDKERRIKEAKEDDRKKVEIEGDNTPSAAA